MKKLYAERDIIDQGDYYARHTTAMTAEGLHSKSDIAAELAHRDIKIEELEERLAEAKSDKIEALNEAVVAYGELDSLRSKLKDRGIEL